MIFLHITKVDIYGYMGFVDFVYSQGRFYDYIVWFLFRSFMDVAFCPSVFELSFCFGFLFVSPLVGAFLK